MSLGGACSAAAAVASGSAAEKHDNVVGHGYLADNVLLGGSADYRADLHSLGDIALIVEFNYLTRGKTDLVAVGRVAVSRARGDLARGQLAVHCVLEGDSRIARAGYAHSLIYIGASRERIADRAAQTGSRAAEGFDFGGVVVGLILELNEPFLGFAVDRYGDLDRAGVNLVALVEVGDHALFLEGLHAHESHIHQRHDAVGVLAVNLVAGRVVFLESVLDDRAESRLFDLDLAESCEEGGVAAVVRPVGVDYPELGNARVAVLLVAEVVAAEFEVVERHGKAHRAVVLSHLVVVPADEALNALNVVGNGSFHVERLGLVEGSQTALNGVDKVILYLLLFLVGKVALESDDSRGEHLAPLALSQKLYALLGGVAALVVLTGEIFHSEDPPAGFYGQSFLVNNVGVRL